MPAVFGVTEDPLLVFTSNMFAILGLRSLYTVLAKAAADLKYLEVGASQCLAIPRLPPPSPPPPPLPLLTDFPCPTPTMTSTTT